MANHVTRRGFLGAAGLAVAAGTAARAGAADEAPKAREPGRVKIVGVACSPRKGRTTAASLGVCLAAAKEVDKRIETELIDLGGLAIDGSLAAGLPLAPGQKDDFPAIARKLADPHVGGVIIASPVYFSSMSSLCKAFLDRWMVFRRNFALADRVGGVLAVGGARNGGQEVVIRSVQDALFCHDMVIVGVGRPHSRFGAAVWSKGGKPTEDQTGMASAKSLGRRVAQVALRLAAAPK